MRGSDGRFIKGVSYNVKNQFKKGEHWRTPQIFREEDWLRKEYVELSDVTATAIIFWLKKFNISRRSTSETRKIKHWGQSGSDNPMWNMKGVLNPMWAGGVTPQRQLFYQSKEWKNVCVGVWERDDCTCQRCKLSKRDNENIVLHIHHIVSFKVVQLRTDINNLILLCKKCHNFVHSKKNVNNDFIIKTNK